MITDKLKLVRLTDTELDSVRFAIADQMLSLKKQATAGHINNDDASAEIESLGRIVEKFTRYTSRIAN